MIVDWNINIFLRKEITLKSTICKVQHIKDFNNSIMRAKKMTCYWLGMSNYGHSRTFFRELIQLIHALMILSQILTSDQMNNNRIVSTGSRKSGTFNSKIIIDLFHSLVKPKEQQCLVQRIWVWSIDVDFLVVTFSQNS